MKFLCFISTLELGKDVFFSFFGCGCSFPGSCLISLGYPALTATSGLGAASLLSFSCFKSQFTPTLTLFFFIIIQNKIIASFQKTFPC